MLQFRQDTQGEPQLQQIPRPGRLQGNTGQDALDIPHLFQQRLQFRIAGVVEQLPDDGLALSQYLLIPQRPVNPAA